MDLLSLTWRIRVGRIALKGWEAMAAPGPAVADFGPQWSEFEELLTSGVRCASISATFFSDRFSDIFEQRFLQFQQSFSDFDENVEALLTQGTLI